MSFKPRNIKRSNIEYFDDLNSFDPLAPRPPLFARHYAFKYFDPLTGDPPSIVEDKASEIVYRARQLLSKRDLKQVLHIGHLLTWLMSCELARDYQDARMDELTNKPREQFIKPFDEVSTLTYLMTQYKLDGLEGDLRDLWWYEIFAVLALGMIDEAAQRAEELKQASVTFGDVMYLDTLAPYAVNAMGAVTVAEYGSLLEQIRKERLKVSNARRKAALKRLEGVRMLKREVRTFYVNGKFKSKAEAVRLFLEGLDKDKRRLLAPTNAERTLRQALSGISKRSNNS